MFNRSVFKRGRLMRFAMISRSVSAPLLMLLLFSLEACTTLDASSIQYAGAPRVPSTRPNTVEILREEPKRPNERLGEIAIDASIKPGPSVEEVEERLRAEGAKLGADAVVIVYDSIQPTALYVTGPWWGGNVTAREGRQLIGVAIKYENETTPRPG